MHVLVMVKAPVAGRVKTRLCPPCTPVQAAAIAAAAITDTLAAATTCGADRCVVALDGRPGPWLPPGVAVVAQRGATFNDRLAAAWDAAGGPGLQIGMDTPQLSGSDLDHALTRLSAPRCDAVLGPAADGGWWLLGLQAPDPRVFDGITMSRATTGAEQHRRLRDLGLGVSVLELQRDVDTFEDAEAVAALAPATKFAAAVRTVQSTLARSGR
jgi:hypothetical protein